MTSKIWQIFDEAINRLDVKNRVAVGVSGGADSMALLHLLCAWNRSSAKPLDLVALTVDHGLREESAREAKAVEGWARDLGISHHTLVWSDRKPSSNIEAAAREARYRLMGDWCAGNQCQTLMTAHHLDDQAETFLMRLSRGSGVSGLSAMTEDRLLGDATGSIRLLRPLLQISRVDLVALLEDVRQPWFEDPGNQDDGFTRSRIRNMRDTFEGLGLTNERIVATAERMSEAQLVLDRVADDFWHQGVTVSPYGEVTLDRDRLVSLAADTRRRVLARALKAVSGAAYAPRYERLLRLEDSIFTGKAGKGVTLHGCKIGEQGDRLSIIRETGRVDDRSLRPGARELWDGRFHIDWAENNNGVENGIDIEDIVIRAVGEAGLKGLRSEDCVLPADVRRDILLTLPAAWREDQLVSAPLLGFGPRLFKARFTLIG